MRKACALIVCALAWSAPAAAASPVCAPRTAPPVVGEATLVADTAVDERLHRLTLRSPALGRDTNVNVLFPQGHDATRRYPVLYLLHGAIGNYNDWNAAGGVTRIVDESGLDPFITVMPDGGTWGFYSDWYGDDPLWPAGVSQDWTQYHVKELIPWVDEHLPTIPERSARAVAGLSMGGFGAMSYAARFPDLFAAAASFSGVVNPNLDYPYGNAFLTGASLFFESGKLRQCVWGDMVTQHANWLAHDPTVLAANLAGTALFISSGGGDAQRPAGLATDPVEQTTYLMSRAFGRALDAHGIPHTDHYPGQGTHSWTAWSDGLRRFLPVMSAAWSS